MVTRLYSELNTSQLYGGDVLRSGSGVGGDDEKWFQLDVTPLDSGYKLK